MTTPMLLKRTRIRLRYRRHQPGSLGEGATATKTAERHRAVSLGERRQQQCSPPCWILGNVLCVILISTRCSMNARRQVKSKVRDQGASVWVCVCVSFQWVRVGGWKEYEKALEKTGMWRTFLFCSGIPCINFRTNDNGLASSCFIFVQKTETLTRKLGYYFPNYQSWFVLLSSV